MGFRSVRQRIRRIARSLALRIPPIKKAAEELESYRQTFRFAPAGHFYSPLPSLEEVSRDAGRLFGPPPEALPGIELNEAAQLALLQRCSPAIACVVGRRQANCDVRTTADIRTPHKHRVNPVCFAPGSS
jgi:hypothetical protein